MIQKALEYIVGMRKAERFDVDGRPYFDKGLCPVHAPIPKALTINTLTGLVDYLNAKKDFSGAVFHGMIYIEGHDTVSLISPLNVSGFMERSEYLHARHTQPVFSFGQYYDVENFIIALQAMFVQDEATAQLLKIVGNLKDETSVITKDDGVTQEVTARQGISMVAQVALPNPVTLRPFRTFREIAQPASSFVFRIKRTKDQAPVCALFEADGKQWQIEAILSIKEFLANALPDATIIG